LLIIPATLVPSATTQAPVRVAMSMDGVRLVLGGKRQGIGEHEPAFGIGC